MNNLYSKNIIRFLAFVFIQVLILKNIKILPDFGVQFFIYPLFIILLHFRTPAWATLLLAFLLGISIDVFYDSLGMHAGASVFTAYARLWLLRIMEPRGGYDPNHFPNKNMMGITWYLQFAGILMFIHLFVYFFLQTFLFKAVGFIAVQSILSFIFSSIIVLLHQYTVYPRGT